MQYEYFLFNIIIITLPLSVSFFPKFNFRRERNVLLLSSCIIAIPFIIWDILVTNSHWYFNPRYTFLHMALIPLPLEEIMFFISVPFASGAIWEVLFVKKIAFWKGEVHNKLTIIYILIPILLVMGILFLLQGRGYTGLTSIALALALLYDLSLGTRLVQQPQFYVYLLMYNLLNLVFNGYLTARPVVTYNPIKQLDIRITTIPIEDFFYGTALIIAVLSLYSFILGRWKRESIFEFMIRKKLCDYRECFHNPTPHTPHKNVAHIRVAVLGSGIAGMSAAILLARKGFAVDVYESESFVGGKCGAWTSSIPHEQNNQNKDLEIEHGFHGVFSNYYNFNHFLDSLKIYDETNFPYIENYCIIPQSKKDIIYIYDEETTPLFNMWKLVTESLKMKMTPSLIIKFSALFVFLAYNAPRIYKKYDKISYQDFRAGIDIHPSLSLIFTTFARAFFSTGEHLSAAELLRSFHFYYCSHNKGLLYRYFKGSYQNLLIQPMLDCLQSLGGNIYLNTKITHLEIQGDISKSTHTFIVNNKEYDNVIISTDVEAAKKIIASSPQISTMSPQFYQDMMQMRAGQQYAVLTLWVEGHLECDQYPVFVNVEKITVIDSVTMKERIDDKWQQWIQDNMASGQGHVLELHCYAIEDKYTTKTDEEIVNLFLDDLTHYYPEFENCSIHYKYLMRNKNFTALHTNMHPHRPAKTEIEGLYLAGDWVQLPFSALLLEAAHTSARLAVNEICTRHGANTETVWMVPQKGVLTI